MFDQNDADNPLDLDVHHDESDFFEVQRRRVLAVLESFDQFSNGTIDVNDVGNVIRCVGLAPSEVEVAKVVDQLSKNPENRVNSEHLMSRVLSAIEHGEWTPPAEALLHAAFETIALDEPLTKSRLQYLLTRFGEPLTDAKMKEMMSHIGVKRNGTIDVKTYVRDVRDELKIWKVE